MSPRAGLDYTTVFQAAAALADEQGIQAVTMATLAKQLNIRPPSLYNHVSGLSALRKDLAVYALEELYQFMKKEAGHLENNEAVYALSKAYITFARKHPGLYEATLAAPNPKDTAVHEAGNHIVALTLQALKHLPLSKDEALHTVRGLRSILHGFASLEQNSGFGLPLDLDQSLTFTIENYLTGIQTKKEN